MNNRGSNRTKALKRAEPSALPLCWLVRFDDDGSSFAVLFAMMDYPKNAREIPIRRSQSGESDGPA
jgi:hypothetical protein